MIYDLFNIYGIMYISTLYIFLWANTAIFCLLGLLIETVERHRLAKGAFVLEKKTAPGTPAQEKTKPQPSLKHLVKQGSHALQASRQKKEESLVSMEEPAAIVKLRQSGKERQDRRIGEILIENNFINKEILEKALVHQQQYGGTITQYLLHFGYVDEKQLTQCLSSKFKVPYLPLDSYQIPEEVVKTIPVDIAEKYWIMPVDRQGDSLMVVMIDPMDSQAIKDLEEITGLNIVPFVGLISEITSALKLYYKVLPEDGATGATKATPYFIDTKTYTGVERRQTIRYKAKIDIRFPVKGCYKKTQTIDVGRGGFSFLSEDSIDLGSVLTLEVNLPSEYSPLPISTITQVVRCVPRENNKFEIGVKILKISKEENNIIVSYASKHREVA